MPPAKHQHPVQTLRAHGVYPPLSMGVRLRRPDRVRSISASSLQNTSSKQPVNLASWSRGRNLAARSWSLRSIAAFRACWVTHAASGLAVTPARTTRLVLRWMKNSTYSVLSRIVSTVKQVARHDPLGLRFEELRPSGPERRGAGPRPCCRSGVLIVVAPTRMPSLRSSPAILTQAHREFSLAIRAMRPATSGSIGGRPDLWPVR
jgi:hypothetical protein